MCCITNMTLCQSDAQNLAHGAHPFCLIDLLKLWVLFIRCVTLIWFLLKRKLNFHDNCNSFRRHFQDIDYWNSSFLEYHCECYIINNISHLSSKLSISFQKALTLIETRINYFLNILIWFLHELQHDSWKPCYFWILCANNEPSAEMCALTSPATPHMNLYIITGQFNWRAKQKKYLIVALLLIIICLQQQHIE